MDRSRERERVEREIDSERERVEREILRESVTV